MKEFDFHLDELQINRLSCTFREKRDVIFFWMQAIKMMLAYVAPDSIGIKGRLCLRIDKMSRLFVETGERSFSMAFPFSVYEIDGGLVFSTKGCPSVDSKLTSDILSLIDTQNIFNSADVLSFSDLVLDIIGDQIELWSLLMHLFNCDDGYLRVDHDPGREKADYHPLDHIDVFYSQSATFKIGNSRKMDFSTFHDFLNVRTKCHFLK